MDRLIALKPLSKSARLGWSHSRYETFSSCKRMYYYQYYGKYDKQFPSNTIWKLKSLTSIPLTIGDVAHKTIEKILNRLITTEVPIDRERLDAFMRDMIHKDASANTFFEIYYETQDSIDEGAIFDKANACVKNFIESDRFEWILSEGVKHKDGWIIEPPGFGETVIEGCKAYAKFDFLYRDENEVLIFDWKSGGEDVEKHAKQLRAYSYWASYHLGADPKTITPVIAYLYPEYQEVECAFDEGHYAEFAEGVREQIANMESYLTDVNQNIPMEKDLFPMRDYGRFCDFCNYKELCYGK